VAARDSLARICECGAVAIIRARASTGLVEAAQALTAGGIEALEFTMNTPEALRLIEDARQALGDDALVGAGTVLDAPAAERAIQAGAQFLVLPGLNRGVVEMAHKHDVLVVPGALTPSEMMTAWGWNVELIKVFPASLGGPAYLRALLGPFSEARLVPTGGVSVENAAEYLRAGAAAVAVGGKLLDQDAILRGDFTRLEALAGQLIAAVHEGRKEPAA